MYTLFSRWICVFYWTFKMNPCGGLNNKYIINKILKFWDFFIKKERKKMRKKNHILSQIIIIKLYYRYIVYYLSGLDVRIFESQTNKILIVWRLWVFWIVYSLNDTLRWDWDINYQKILKTRICMFGKVLLFYFF